MSEEYVCPMCGESFDSAKSRGMHRRWNHDNPWEDRDKLYQKYVEERKSIPKIADEWDCGETTVEQALEREEIETRDRGENYGDEPWKDPETLERLYWDEEMCFREIAEHLDCSPDKVRYNMEVNEIPRRGDGGFSKDTPWRDKETLKEGLERTGSVDELAREWGCSPTTIAQRKDRYGIDLDVSWRGYRRDYSIIRHQHNGEDHQIRVHRLVAYAHGMLSFEELFDPLVHIHHKNGNTWINSPENLEALTPKEHMNRHDWEHLKTKNRC